jgi:hypothetical protein
MKVLNFLLAFSAFLKIQNNNNDNNKKPNKTKQKQKLPQAVPKFMNYTQKWRREAKKEV